MPSFLKHKKSPYKSGMRETARFSCTFPPENALGREELVTSASGLGSDGRCFQWSPEQIKERERKGRHVPNGSKIGRSKKRNECIKAEPRKREIDTLL